MERQHHRRLMRRRWVTTSGICGNKMHPPLTLHRHPMCAEIIEEFQKCHADHPVKKFFGECTDLKIKLDRCFRQEKALKRKANFEQSKKLRERLQAYRKEDAEKIS
ncbi:PREDICTED: COX assembly mitochondrial protein 2 homolog isoform X1 [Nelumbo nucifera]|uniref:COX assembly mitochondrial protein n=2 Tax=Nelumbo nucifera TaxID=4432 RepID=A0A1U8B2N8_NELNU|nr:PREDICTED: COX assembly mitochondrial protein 2 homolog isoform X1 [Nelumbo nucifera]XP_010274999.1 PREDICTED: COX assembly mitochondrial protein 2 homolog isoform X1 [Nelumbo nucifera]